VPGMFIANGLGPAVAGIDAVAPMSPPQPDSNCAAGSLSITERPIGSSVGTGGWVVPVTNGSNGFSKAYKGGNSPDWENQLDKVSFRSGSRDRWNQHRYSKAYGKRRGCELEATTAFVRLDLAPTPFDGIPRTVLRID